MSQVHYEAVIYSKECNTKLIEEDTKQQLSKAEERHQAEIDTMTQKMDEVANAIWNDAREQFTTAADEEVAHSLATTKSQYKGLLDENFEMRRILDEKERDMKEMEDTFQDVASDVNRLHAKEMVGVSDQASRLMQDNDRLKKAMREIGIESDNLRDELDHCKMTIRSLEFKSNEQMKIMDTVDTSKSESSSRINELTACNELRKRQMKDMLSENKELVAENEKQRIVIRDLSCNNDDQVATIDKLRETNQSNEARCTTLMQNLHDARGQITSVEKERQAYATQTNQLLERNDRLLSEKISMYEQKLASTKDEANSIVQTAQSDVNVLSNECNNLRSRVLQLQREKWVLEQDLMDSHHRKQRYPEQPTPDTHKLNEENKALKEILSMMRNEMESAVSEDSPAESSRESIIERQLSLCRTYLDLLLNTSDKTSTKHDEFSFLRAKNRDLLQMIDELRHESLLNHTSQPSGIRNNGDVPSMQEQHLISRLEEASDEIDALLEERDQLMKLSNELKFELQQANQKVQSNSTSYMKERAQEDEGAGQILDAILNDFSASHDGESQEESEAVACIGTKLPTGNTTNVRASFATVHLYLHFIKLTSSVECV